MRTEKDTKESNQTNFRTEIHVYEKCLIESDLATLETWRLREDQIDIFSLFKVMKRFI